MELRVQILPSLEAKRYKRLRRILLEILKDNNDVGIR